MGHQEHQNYKNSHQDHKHCHAKQQDYTNNPCQLSFNTNNSTNSNDLIVADQSEHFDLNSYAYVNQQCCCFNMRKIMRAVTQYYDRNLEISGIRSTQFTLLIALAATSAKTLTEIADSLVMDRTTLTRNLKPLAKMGLITIINTLDKRSKAYTLTDKGKELVNTCIPLWQTAQELVMQSMGLENYQDVIKKLENLIQILALQK